MSYTLLLYEGIQIRTHQLYEWRDDGRVAHLLDDQHRHRRLVPGQALGGRILDGPAKREEAEGIFLLSHAFLMATEMETLT